jgi:hypothetical protein
MPGQAFRSGVRYVLEPPWEFGGDSSRSNDIRKKIRKPVSSAQ